jgi:FKBP-type peptidyl-prolyl cis-trans isomerase
MILKLMAFLGVLILVAPVIAEEPQVFKSEKEKMSYGIGVQVMRNFKQQGLEVDIDLIIKGMRDALSGGKLPMTDEELRKTMISVQNDLRLKQKQTRRMAVVDNQKEGDTFLAENKKREGVVALPSGLQYKILKAGDGGRTADADMVECHYQGTLINGSVFDSSDLGGQPAILEVKGLIPGWREALKLMPVGSKWQLFIPPHLAYGERGEGGIVGPNSTLILEVELLAIK